MYRGYQNKSNHRGRRNEGGGGDGRHQRGYGRRYEYDNQVDGSNSDYDDYHTRGSPQNRGRDDDTRMRSRKGGGRDTDPRGGSNRGGMGGRRTERPEDFKSSLPALPAMEYSKLLEGLSPEIKLKLQRSAEHLLSRYKDRADSNYTEPPPQEDWYAVQLGMDQQWFESRIVLYGEKGAKMLEVQASGKDPSCPKLRDNQLLGLVQALETRLKSVSPRGERVLDVKIDISDNEFSDEGLHGFLRKLIEFPRSPGLPPSAVSYLNISGNNLSLKTQDMQLTVKDFVKSVPDGHLRKISLSRNEVDSKALASLGLLLSSESSEQVLVLEVAGNRVDPQLLARDLDGAMVFVATEGESPPRDGSYWRVIIRGSNDQRPSSESPPPQQQAEAVLETLRGAQASWPERLRAMERDPQAMQNTQSLLQVLRRDLRNASNNGMQGEEEKGGRSGGIVEHRADGSQARAAPPRNEGSVDMSGKVAALQQLILASQGGGAAQPDTSLPNGGQAPSLVKSNMPPGLVPAEDPPLQPRSQSQPMLLEVLSNALKNMEPATAEKMRNYIQRAQANPTLLAALANIFKSQEQPAAQAPPASQAPHPSVPSPPTKGSSLSDVLKNLSPELREQLQQKYSQLSSLQTEQSQGAPVRGEIFLGDPRNGQSEDTTSQQALLLNLLRTYRAKQPEAQIPAPAPPHQELQPRLDFFQVPMRIAMVRSGGGPARAVCGMDLKSAKGGYEIVAIHPHPSQDERVSVGDCIIAINSEKLNLSDADKRAVFSSHMRAASDERPPLMTIKKAARDAAPSQGMVLRELNLVHILQHFPGWRGALQRIESSASSLVQKICQKNDLEGGLVTPPPHDEQLKESCPFIRLRGSAEKVSRATEELLPLITSFIGSVIEDGNSAMQVGIEGLPVVSEI